MGTWGSGPFDSDSAMDLVETLSPLSMDERIDQIRRIFDAALRDAEAGTTTVVPEEVLAGAAVVAANLPKSIGCSWPEADPDLAQWLPHPLPGEFPAQAKAALRVAIPVHGWWWQSWVDAADKAAMEWTVERIETALDSASTP